MLIFIDTEFTDFYDTDLISIGLVTDDGLKEFYAELSFDASKCSDFVVQNVLPLLEYKTKEPSLDLLNLRLREWLSQFKFLDEVVICFDFSGDWELFLRVLENKLPDWLTCKNIYHETDEANLISFFCETGLSRHHALHDARANRYAYLKRLRKDI